MKKMCTNIKIRNWGEGDNRPPPRRSAPMLNMFDSVIIIQVCDIKVNNTSIVITQRLTVYLA